ncbi:MAG: hypothetical protein WCO06_05610 [Candidatus Roizmanbacteria bacterium]
MANSKGDFIKQLDQLDQTLEEYFLKKAPFQLPENVREIIVLIVPYLNVIGVVIGALGIVTALGVTAVFAPLVALAGAVAPSTTILSLVALGFSVVVIVCDGLAIPGLFNKTKQGWKYVWYAGLISTLSFIVTMNIIGGIFGFVVGMYILYQVKSHYK